LPLSPSSRAGGLLALSANAYRVRVCLS